MPTQTEKYTLNDLNIEELKRSKLENHSSIFDLTDKNLDLFWGEWLKGKGAKSSESGVWDDWLKGKNRVGGGDADAKNGGSVGTGWTAPDDDLSDADDDAWTAGGIKRPGSKDSEEYSSEEAMEDEWGNDDDDGDDHGGQMMPIPNFP